MQDDGKAADQHIANARLVQTSAELDEVFELRRA